MHQVTVPQAREALASLIDEVASGEEVVITDNKKPVAKLVRVEPAQTVIPRFGSAKGLIHISDDFDEPLGCFKDYNP